MKKIILCSLLLLGFISCKKDSNNPPASNDELYDIVLNISTFNQSYEDMKIGSTKNLANIQKIECRFFDENGQLVSTINSFNEDADFGLIKAKLPAGKYKAVIAAFNKSGIYSRLEGSTFLDCSIYFFPSQEYWGYNDIFFTVADIDSKPAGFSQDLILRRATGLLEFIIEDEIPAEVSSIVIKLIDLPRSYMITRKLYGIDAGTSRSFSPQDISLSNPVTSIIGADEDVEISFSVAFEAMKEDGSIYVRKEVNGIKVFKNRKTILSGKLFSNDETDNGGSFKVNVDNEWGEDNLITF